MTLEKSLDLSVRESERTEAQLTVSREKARGEEALRLNHSGWGKNRGTGLGFGGGAEAHAAITVSQCVPHERNG